MQIHSYSLLAAAAASSSSSSTFFVHSQFKPHKKPFFFFLSNKTTNFSPTHSLSNNNNSNYLKETEPLELLTKPSLIPLPEDPNPEKPSEDLGEALAPFLKFFKPGDFETIDETDPEPPNDPILTDIKKPMEEDKVRVEYYEPKPGDLVAGVVVSGNENKLDVNVGADLLGTMLTKEVMPFYKGELDYLSFDLEKEKEESCVVKGKMGVVKDEEALNREKVEGRPVVEVGTVIFVEVMGRTLSGRPLLSSRRMYRRVAWHRVRQIKQLNEPIEVKIFEWNTGGLLTRIEGLRAFLPKAELMNRVDSFMDLKENVGRRLFVSIVRIDVTTNDLIISEKEAWNMVNLKEGTLLEGTVRKIFPYGAQVRIGDTKRSGLLHISNITCARVPSVSDVLAVDEKVKVLVVKSMFPDKISLSIADLESEAGLFLSDKEKVFSEAEEMAKRYRQRLPIVPLAVKSDPGPVDMLPFDDEAKLYANWKWFKFEQHKEMDSSDDNTSQVLQF